MQASETKLQDIIEGTKQYVVPMFQWREINWGDDIEVMIIKLPTNYYFIDF